jgi:GAF domain-containing protein
VRRLSRTGKAKRRRSKAVAIDRSKKPTACHADNDPNRIIEGLRCDLDEAFDQLAATADVLKVISHSTFDLKIVLDTLVESAVRLCDSYDAMIFLRENESLVLGAHHGPIPIDIKKWPITRDWTAGCAVLDGKAVHVNDLSMASEYPEGQIMAKRMGNRTTLSVPLLLETKAIGCITVRRLEVKPFTEKQINLITTFADQAVIAIENVRLFEAEQQRTRELSESLEQQTATSEVLRLISSSPGELQPVFLAMLENAVRICEAKFGTMFLREGDAFRTVALHNAPPAYAELRRRNPIIYLHLKTALARLVATRQVVHITDILEDQGYLAGAPNTVAIFETAGARTFLLVPMLKANEVVGAILIYRQ